MIRPNNTAALAICLVLTAGCSSATDGRTESTTAVPPSAVDTSADPTRDDADLILTMYDDINTAFQANPDDGVRAIIASQYPDDLADVDFARCVAAIAPGATTLPPTKKLHFDPNITTMSLDPEYTVTSDHVKNLHPQGRIYATDIAINDGTKPTVHQRHQVILNGRAYQFSAC
jgi:hypothetical protein